MSRLAAQYDSDPGLSEVVVTRCTTQFDEPFLRQMGPRANRTAYLAAGYTTAADQACMAEQLETHARWWKQTRSSKTGNCELRPELLVGSPPAWSC